MSAVLQSLTKDLRAAAPSAGAIAALAQGKLYALQHPFALDGRVSSYPASARGYSVANSYLLTQPDAAMLIDTGFGKDEPAIRAQIESLIAPEAAAVAVPAAAERVHVDQQRRNRSPGTSTSSNATPAIPTRRCGSISAPRRTAADILESMPVTAVDARGHDPARQARPPDRRHAGADPADRHALALRRGDARRCSPPTCSPTSGASAPDGPWIVTDDDDDHDRRASMRSFMLNTRYWWLEGAPTDSIRRGIADVFDKYDIETIAPGYGCILRGRKMVARHYRMLRRDSQGAGQERGGVALRRPRRGALMTPMHRHANRPTGCRARSRPACSGSATAWRSATRARSITATTPRS